MVRRSIAIGIDVVVLQVIGNPVLVRISVWNNRLSVGVQLDLVFRENAVIVIVIIKVVWNAISIEVRERGVRNAITVWICLILGGDAITVVLCVRVCV